MPERKKIAVYIDYSLRTPSFYKTYSLFLNFIFDNGENKDLEDTPVSFFWKSELTKPEVKEFYLKQKNKTLSTDDYEYKDLNFADFFYNEEHYKNFLEEYTFNLYANADSPSNKDIQLLNIAQSFLFDVILIDEYIFPRKKLNTFYFLSKQRIMPGAVLFLGPGQSISEESYFAIWNPKKYPDQINGNDYGDFEIWLKDLESQLKPLE